MKTLHRIPPLLNSDDRALPPGGALLIVIGSSFLFWALLIWLVL
ncbi:MAG: hypothetical protein WDN44_11175 [Sphingomonas sp.]